MTNDQLYLAIGIPILFNSALSVAWWLNLRSNMNDRFNRVNERFASVNQRFDDYARSLAGRTEPGRRRTRCPLEAFGGTLPMTAVSQKRYVSVLFHEEVIAAIDKFRFDAPSAN